MYVLKFNDALTGDNGKSTDNVSIKFYGRTIDDFSRELFVFIIY